MKLMLPVLFALFVFTNFPVMAQDRVVGTSPPSRVTLELYDQPSATAASREINVSEAGLPLTTEAKQTGFFKVVVGGKDYWVRSSKVRVSRDTSGNCGAVASLSSELTAATPGAGKNACK